MPPEDSSLHYNQHNTTTLYSSSRLRPGEVHNATRRLFITLQPAQHNNPVQLFPPATRGSTQCHQKTLHYTTTSTTQQPCKLFPPATRGSTHATRRLFITLQPAQHNNPVQLFPPATRGSTQCHQKTLHYTTTSTTQQPCTALPACDQGKYTMPPEDSSLHYNKTTHLLMAHGCSH